MNYLMERARDIECFIEGTIAVCKDKDIVAEKTKERFGNKYSKLIDYLILLETEQLSPKTLAKLLNNRDLDDGFYRFEQKCAAKSNLVIVSGYSDDLIELEGAIRQEENCFCGGVFHLKRQKEKWTLEKGTCKNNISAVWCDSNGINDNLEVIPWTYKTDIPCELFYATFRGDPFCEGFVFKIEDLK